MRPVSNRELIEIAAGVLKPHTVKDRVFGDVGAALLSDTGQVYTGVSVDTPGWGLCAERTAIASMITAGQYRIARIVAVWRNQQSGKLHVLPPCGICREFIHAVHENNFECEVILGRSNTAKLGTLLPSTAWPEPIGLN